ncbi:VWA domain-containing protein [Paenibacillus harenae]|uniref:VWA domain-containing protein n=1 Tax=Paenibacillus harenae TaxID=306543 RepID=UPI0027929912|nr:VWA domain-containing protein [Paenibacillus harenae]MDQ0061103.1 hypothetical protein [Paenibacillus harenae]
MEMSHSFRRSIWKTVAMFVGAAILVWLLNGCSANNSDTAGSGNQSNSESTNDAGESVNGGVGDSSEPSSGDSKSEESRPDRKENKGKRGYGSQDKEVQAGQLTAGEWDDLAAWERFGNLLNSQEGDSSLRAWSFAAFNRVEVIVTAGGKAVADAEVIVTQGGQSVWEARTNTEGRAFVFAGLFDRQENQRQSDYVIEARAGQQTKRLENIDITKQGVVKVDLGSESGSSLSDQVDVMFVVDTTGSMEDELNYLGAELKDVIQRVSEEHANQLDIRLSANFYRDKHDDYVVKPHPFVTNVDTVTGWITKENARGGGDFPEAVDQALRDAIHEHEWSKEARARLLFLVLDAPPHSDPQIIDEVQKLIQDAAKQGIRIIPVASSGVDVDTEYLLRFMGVSTGGTYLFLTDDSGIGGDHLEPAIGEYEVKLLNDLLVEVINRYVQQ